MKMSSTILQSLDVSLFIAEVQKEPAIWDQNSDENNRYGKKEAWDRICDILCPNFQELNTRQKENISVALQRKWKNLRDCFNREVKLLEGMNQRSITSKKRKYIFFDQLSFLLPLKPRHNVLSSTQGEEDTEEDSLVGEEQEQTSKDTNQSNWSVVETSLSSEITSDSAIHQEVSELFKETRRNKIIMDKKDYSYSEATDDTMTLPSKRVIRKVILYHDDLSSGIPHNEEVAQPLTKTKRKKKKVDEEDGTERYHPDIAEEAQAERANLKSQDEDTLFCLSLAHDLRRISDDLKCDAKCAILQVLKDYKIYSSPLYENIQESRKLVNQHRSLWPIH